MRPSKPWKRERKSEYLPLIRSHYIFCEGEKTEPSYFRNFAHCIRSNPIYKNMPIHVVGCAMGTKRILEQAVTEVERNNVHSADVWCVYDKDDFPKDDFDNVFFKIKELNSQPRYRSKDLRFRSAWSNECIEFWFLLHFEFLTSNVLRSDYVAKLSRHFKQTLKTGYRKNHQDIFNQLLDAKGSPKLAIRFAKKILNENKGQIPSKIAPGTAVHELVEELARYLPDEKKDYFF